MNKENYIEIINEKIKNKNSKQIMINQINNYYDSKANYKKKKHNYKIDDQVLLKKGTLLHGTFKNIEGLKYILKDGLISSWFIEGRLSKYPSSVGVWNLKQDYLLKDYINFYSGGTIEYKNIDGSSVKTEVIPYNQMPSIMLKIDTNICFRWYMEQTKEARFMPSLVQDKVQVGIIFDGQSEYMKKLLEGDILSEQINDKDVKEFVKPDYYAKFLVDRKNYRLNLFNCLVVTNGDDFKAPIMSSKSSFVNFPHLPSPSYLPIKLSAVISLSSAQQTKLFFLRKG